MSETDYQFFTAFLSMMIIVTVPTVLVFVSSLILEKEDKVEEEK